MIDTRLLATLLIAAGIIAGAFFGYRAFAEHRLSSECKKQDRFEEMMGYIPRISNEGKMRRQAERERCATVGIYLR